MNIRTFVHFREKCGLITLQQVDIHLMVKEILEENADVKTFEIRHSVTFEVQGQKVFGILHLPIESSCDNKVPAVLLCHGLGGNKSGKFRLFTRISEHLAKKGIASLRFDFRGSGDSEGAFQETTFESQIEDALRAHEQLASHLFIDPEQIGILGRSFGGAIAVVAAARSRKYKAIALWAPVFDAKPWLEQDHQRVNGSVHTNIFFDKESKKVRFNGEIVNTIFLKEFLSLQMNKELEMVSSLPLLHIRGEKDLAIVPYHQEKYQDARTKSMMHLSRFIFLPLSDHDFSERAEQACIIEETVDWFLEHLQHKKNY